MLETGIIATKLNYSNTKERTVRLRILGSSTKQPYLVYETVERRGCLSDLGGRTRKISLSAFTDLIYGGTSSTFKRFAKKIKQEDENRESLRRSGSVSYLSKKVNLEKIAKINYKYDEADDLNEVFTPWTCISLVKHDETTLDFRIDDPTPLMAFIHITYAKIRGLDESQNQFMKVFQMLKFKMKLSYSCWREKKDMSDHVLKSIKDSIDEKL